MRRINDDHSDRTCAWSNSLNRPQPWVLEDAPGVPSHRGQLEGGLSEAGATAGYFVLLREGDAFTAIPADEFYNFRPERRRAHSCCAHGSLADGK